MRFIKVLLLQLIILYSLLNSSTYITHFLYCTGIFQPIEYYKKKERMIKIDSYGHYYNPQDGKYYKKGKYYRKKRGNIQNKLRETKSEINQTDNLDSSL